MREDYSWRGNAWKYLPHDYACSCAHHYNEDGLAEISDRRQMLCFALALWNERDPILKGGCEKYYFYLDNTLRTPKMEYLY